MNDLPANVYRVRQRDFTAIPREPWVYWIPDDLRQFFKTLPALGDVAQPKQGLATANNFRFLRGWWEVDREHIGFGCRDASEAKATGKRWFPYMKGGEYHKWYGNQSFVVNWQDNGKEIRNFYKPSGRLASRPQNTDYYFQEGVTWSDLSSKGFGVRYLPPGFVFDVKGSSGFPSTENLLTVLAVMNSPWIGFALSLLNPTVSFQVGDISRVPFKQPNNPARGKLEELTRSAVGIRQWEAMKDELTFDFIVPYLWRNGLEKVIAAEVRLAGMEDQINDEIYRLYGISDTDRAAIESELNGEPLPDISEHHIEPPMDREELAVRWISYAVGIVLGRFKVGAIDDSSIDDSSIDDLRLTIDETSADQTEIVNRKSKIVNRPIGNAVYRREDFAVGSLPAPSEEEFDELVGPPERFAYVDETGGRHVFPAEVEAALRELALPDGIAVLDEGHPRDLPTLVEKALHLMLDFRLTIDDGTIDDLRLTIDENPVGDSKIVNRKSKIANRQSEEVIRIGAGGDLRKFLTKDFFTDWHIKWYNIPYQAKAPVYWPLQSANRRYGFVLFHETIDKTTLYTLQRDYMDYKISGLQQRIGDLTAEIDGLQGSRRKAVARDVAALRETLAEVEAFAKTMARIVREGYEPEPNWIDDRVVLRMAPLWELVPLWDKYLKKYWKQLQKGEYDWSHIAMHYWPERVREACRENKSYAIAHGLDD